MKLRILLFENELESRSDINDDFVFYAYDSRGYGQTLVIDGHREKLLVAACCAGHAGANARTVLGIYRHDHTRARYPGLVIDAHA